jgi:glyoxylase-like metal-dependent hydrolase (beta-lactamase superfamily II)
MKFQYMLLITAFVSFASFTAAHAGEKEDELIARVVAAYGGDLFTGLSNVKIEDNFMTLTVGQSHVAGETEIGRSKQVLLLDLKEGKFSSDSFNKGRGGDFQGLTIGTGDKAYTINLAANTYGDARSADPYVLVGGTMRTSDTVLAYELNKNKDQATLLEDQRYLNRSHHVIKLPFPQSPDLQLFIDAESYLVSKMVRINPQLGELTYVYSGHKKIDGVTSATGIVFSIAGNPQLISTKHTLTFNNSTTNAFSIPSGLSKEGDRVDDEGGVVNKLSDRVYHIGRDGGYSIFIDTSVGVVAAGGYPALTQRFDTFKTESGRYKPLAYQVVTHHHSDHVGGVSEAVELGAKLVTIEDNVAAIQGATTPAPAGSDFLAISSRVTFGEGKNRVEVYEVSTVHAASFLVTYVPSTKTVFIADHFGSAFANSIPDANQATVDMFNALKSLKIDIRKIATAHNPRIYTMQEMSKSVAGFKPASCIDKRPVCL